MATPLALFPLTTVLVPGLVLPLHIFEDRYRLLVAALMALPEGATREFGVVAIRTGREVGADGVTALFDVGCTAELREVTPYSDGRFDIVTVGRSRFRLHGIDDAAGTPYHTGLVDYLREPDGAPEGLADLTARVQERFGEYVARLGVDQPPETTDDPRVTSYIVAAATVLDLAERQALLEAPTTRARLEAELMLLRRETTMVATFGALPAVDLLRGGMDPN